jgi:CubicO group peptidase (beta-lactamase class C family)
MKKSLNIILLTCLLVFIQYGYQPPPGEKTGLKTLHAIEKHEFAQLLSKVRQQHGIPGIAAVLVSSKGILNIGVAGVCRVDKPGKLEISHRFHIGSNTKALTGLLAGIMVNKKMIRWDTGFFKLFPGLKKDAKEVYYNITLKDLLCHQARIRPFMRGYEFARLPEFQGTVPEKRKAFAAWLVQQEPVEIDPEKGYAYSNAGYAMAAAMLEKVSGKSWEGEDTLVPAESIKYLLYGNMGKSEYNIGWGSRKIDGYTYSSHSRSAGTFFARAAVIRELDLAAAIFVSSASPGALKGVRELMNKLTAFI